MLLCLVFGAALGADPQFYHPDDATGLSKRFAHAADVAGGALERAEAESAGLSSALDDYELALHALGDRAGTTEHDRYFLMAGRYRTELADMQGFVGKLSDDLSTAFESAFGRAVSAFPAAVECRATITGSALPGLPSRSRPNADCAGKDVNADIAAAMDDDRQLGAALDEILGRTWPAFTHPDDHGTPIGTGSRTVEVAPLLEAVAPKGLRAIAMADEQDRIPIAAALEEGVPPERLREKARAITERTAAARRELATPILAAAEKVGTKKKEPFAWCASPASLGGCGADDATKSLVPRLAADRKVQAAAP